MNLGSVSVALCALALSMTLVAQTGAVTSMSAERSIEVAVADDEDALLGIEVQSVEVQRNATENVTLLTAENRLDRPVDLDATATGDEDTQRLNVTAVDAPESLSSGELGSVVATVECTNATTAEMLTVALSASGGGTSVELSRNMHAQCV
ncbi:hypothetical protein [Haloarcula sp. 1CSR25-25]|uniref:hypothetical protein n=1 Tax=Haloarcula sp. 1CSR25-25 TaxID=2862545 RepID=UPI0028952C4D|nr:hypothetical protein [Haloarcula sp. 1CSR25-25]MDT3434844.1 hypothetical protein [Haloarcula sp. 1CSR25-25]